jgi:hypothetical protein
MGRKCKKDVIYTEQSEGTIANKGVSFSRGSKQTAFSGQKPPIKAKNMAKNPPVVGIFPSTRMQETRYTLAGRAAST